MVLELTDHWPVAGKDPEQIEFMDMPRVANLVQFLERRYKMSNEEKRTYGMVEKSPLYKSLMSRLPIATEEWAKKAERKIARGTAPHKSTVTVGNKGKSLTELQASAGTGKHPAPQLDLVSSKSWMDAEDIALVLDLARATVVNLMSTGGIPGARKVASPNGGPDKWEAPTEEVTKIKERRDRPEAKLKTQQAKDASELGNEQRTKDAEERREAAKAMAPPIIDHLTTIHDSLGNALLKVSQNDQILLDGMNAQHGDMVTVVNALADSVKAVVESEVRGAIEEMKAVFEIRLTKLVEHMNEIDRKASEADVDDHDAVTARLDRIEELARTAAENSVAPKKGKR